MYWQEKRPLAAPEPSSHAYRLKLWPAIPDQFRTARVLRACSRMSVGPVTVNWFLEATGLEAAEAAELVANLERQGAIERIELGPRDAQPAAPARAAPAATEEAAARNPHRLPWRHAAVAALVCAGVSAALDPGLRAEFALIALRDLPALWS
jgi:hypothetical protein